MAADIAETLTAGIPNFKRLSTTTRFRRIAASDTWICFTLCSIFNGIDHYLIIRTEEKIGNIISLSKSKLLNSIGNLLVLGFKWYWADTIQNGKLLANSNVVQSRKSSWLLSFLHHLSYFTKITRLCKLFVNPKGFLCHKIELDLPTKRPRLSQPLTNPNQLSSFHLQKSGLFHYFGSNNLVLPNELDYSNP